jgi:ribulose-phosphate 3-epimerase
LIDERKLRCVIEVDGGIDVDTLPAVVQAGAEILVAGSAIFQAPDPARKIQEMLEIAVPLSYHSNYV